MKRTVKPAPKLGKLKLAAIKGAVTKVKKKKANQEHGHTIMLCPFF